MGLYYPPANFMAGRRLEGWARHLPDFGYEPLVLTRFYDPEERNSHDFYASSRPTRTLAEPWVETGAAVYTRFVPGLWSRLPLPGKVRGLGHYAWPDPDHSVWLRQCEDYLKRTGFRPDLIIGSYGPPGVLRVARKLSERMGVPWVADFRDLWIEQFDRTLDTRLKYFLQRRHLRTVAGITVVSDAMADAVKSQLAPLEKPVRLIYNGAEPFDDVRPDPHDGQALEAFAELTREGQTVLSYAGTLYPAQQIGPFLDAVAKYNRQSSRPCTVVLLGRHDPRDYAGWPFVRALGRVGHATALFLQRRSTALFYPTWPQRYSGFSGKLFEQILSGRPVLIAFEPSSDVESFCRKLPSVTVAKDYGSLAEALNGLSESGGAARAWESPEIATKRYWAGELASFLDEVLAGRGRGGV